MIDLEPVHSGIWDCYEDCLETICQHLEVNPIHMFSKSWNFFALPKEGILTKQFIKQKNAKQILLEKCVNVKSHSKDYSDIEELKALCAKKIPIIIAIDMYELPWSEYYKKIHSPHSCIIVGYDADKKQFKLVDPTIMKKNIFLKEEDISFVKRYEVLEVIPSKKDIESRVLIKEMLQDFHNEAQSGDAFEEMHYYAKHIVNELLERNPLETHPNNPLDSEVFLHILFTSRNRFTYAEWLEYMGEKEAYKAYIEVAKVLKEVGLKWQNLRMKLMRELCQNNLTKHRGQLEQYITEIIMQEKRIYQQLDQLIKQDNVMTTNKADEYEDQVIVDKEINLMPYRNASAFYKRHGINTQGGFDGEGYFYYTEEELQEEKDHLICEGQQILLDDISGEGIRIYASASKGHYIENIKIVFEDDTEAILSIGFSDWWEQKPLCGEEIAWAGACGKLEKGVFNLKGKVHIFKKDFWFKDKRQIKEIQLPINHNLHIFQIESLGKKRILPIRDSIKTRHRLSQDEMNYWHTWKPQINQLIKADNENIIYSNGSKENQIAITFDDAPDGIVTPQILDILKAYDVKATFSVIGCYLPEHGALLKRIYEEGHQIVNHTWHHYYLTQCKPTQIIEELRRTEQEISRITGKKPKFMRPPYGNVDEAVKVCIQSMDMKVLLWSYNTYDWAAKCKEDILYKLVDQVREGEILLFHSYENKQPTVECLPVLIKTLRNRGFNLVTVSELLDVEAYYD